MANCVVTGVAGFIGSTLADRLISEGHTVTGIDCFVDYYPRKIKEANISKLRESSNFNFIESDLNTLDLVKLLEGVDYVYHQAAQAGVRASWGETFSIYTNNNILATQRLLEACRDDAVKGTLKKVVYASSSSVYGAVEKLPTYETDLPCPLSPYGVSKLAAENLMVLYSNEFGVPTASLRYFTVYGPRQRPDMAFHKFIKATLTGNEIHIYGDGEQSRDFTFIEDIIDCNVAAATVDFKKQGKNLYFNTGGGSRVTVNEVLQMIREITGQNPKVVYMNRATGDVPHTGSDWSLAKNVLGYTPKVQLFDGLKKEVEWVDQMLKMEIL